MDCGYLNWNDLNRINNRIDWKSNVGFTLLFYINGEKHSLKIIEDCGIHGKSHYVKVKFDNNVVKDFRTERLKTLEFKKIYYQYSFKYQPGDIVNGLRIIKQIAQKREKYNWVEKKYQCICLKDSYEFITSENSLERNCGCPVCSNRKIIAGINDVATTDPWMVTYFKDKSEAYKYSSRSGHTITCKCPICGEEKITQIEVLHRYGFRCNFCSDKISHPNKLMTYALLQLQNNNIIRNFQREFSAQWAGGYKYDGYFEMEKFAFIIEMDGGFHFNDNTFNNQKYQDTQKLDELKKSLAESHDIIVLRVDCNYKTMTDRDSYIINNLKTTLSNYLDVSTIDWDKCISQANNNLVYEICDKYKSGLGRKQIGDQYSWLSNTTIGNYLQIGTQCGFCDYDSGYSKKYTYIYLLDSSGRIIEKVRSVSNLLDILLNKYSIKLNRSTIYRTINKNKTILGNYSVKADLVCRQEV